MPPGFKRQMRTAKSPRVRELIALLATDLYLIAFVSTATIISSVSYGYVPELAVTFINSINADELFYILWIKFLPLTITISSLFQ